MPTRPEALISMHLYEPLILTEAEFLRLQLEVAAIVMVEPGEPTILARVAARLIRDNLHRYLDVVDINAIQRATTD